MSEIDVRPEFVRKVCPREALPGTFLKSSVCQPVEILGAAGLDFFFSTPKTQP